MKIKTLTIIPAVVGFCLSLAACSTSQQRYNQDYNTARQNFTAQNYQAAYSQLQAPAKAGNADAQYALGYMYYYGKGTNANPAKAKYWFQQAAKNGQKNAQNALQLMQPGNTDNNAVNG